MAVLAPIAKVDDLVDATRERAAEFGATVWGRAAGHLIHVAAFIALVLKRDHTTLRVLGWLEHVLGTAAAGIPASLVHVASESFDGLWSLLLAPMGL